MKISRQILDMLINKIQSHDPIMIKGLFFCRNMIYNIIILYTDAKGYIIYEICFCERFHRIYMPQIIPSIQYNSAPSLWKETFFCLPSGCKCPSVFIARKKQHPSKDFPLLVCKGNILLLLLNTFFFMVLCVSFQFEYLIKIVMQK